MGNETVASRRIDPIRSSSACPDLRGPRDPDANLRRGLVIAGTFSFVTL